MSRRRQWQLVLNLLFSERRSRIRTTTTTSTTTRAFSASSLQYLDTGFYRASRLRSNLCWRNDVGRVYVRSFSASPELPPPTTDQSPLVVPPPSTDNTQDQSDFSQKKPKKKNYFQRSNTGSKNKFSAEPSQLLQLRKLHPKDTIEQHFERMALQIDLAKLKFMSKLRDVLLQKRNEDTSLWQATEAFFETRKSLPLSVKSVFWNLVIAPTTTNDNKKHKKSSSTNVTKKTIAILQQAQERAAQKPIFWNHKHKHLLLNGFIEAGGGKEEESTKSALQWKHDRKKRHKDLLPTYLEERAKQLSALHASKDEAQRLEDATQMAEYLHGHLPPELFERTLTILEKFGSESPPTKNLTKLQQSLHPFCTHAIRWAGHTHVHWIISELTAFLYVTATATVTANSKDGHGEFESNSSDHVAKLLATDNKIQQRRDTWETARDDFVESFQQVQELLIQEHEGIRGETVIEKDIDDEGYASISEEDDIALVEEVEPLDSSEESVLKTLQEASKVPEGSKPSQKATELSLLRPRTYISYEALATDELGISAAVAADPQPPHLYQPNAFDHTDSTITTMDLPPPPTERLIFVDNLPIDMDEQILRASYERCGDIEDIQIFHRRLDLDPGRKSNDSKKKIRKPSNSNRQAWERPRTPLYAQILYKETAGAQKASVDPLRIFGMVLDKHLMRSHPASEMTRLYIEDIAPHHDATSIEYELTQVLHTKLYVCLDIERGRRRKRKRDESPLNAILQFPDFESAYWANTRLSHELDRLRANNGAASDIAASSDHASNEGGKDGKSCDDDIATAIHWLPTPRDAMLYWTRRLNF